MSVKHTRMRQLTREQQMGGGLTGESLTDTATDHDVLESYTGTPIDQESDEPEAVSIDYDDLYGGQATKFDTPTPDPYTHEEAMHDLSKYGELSLPKAQDNHDVSEVVRFGTVVLNVGADPYLLAGQNAARKSITVKNVSFPDSKSQCDINVGNDASVPNRIGSGGLMLRGGIGILGMLGDSITLTTSDEIWIVQCVDRSEEHTSELVTQ